MESNVMPVVITLNLVYVFLGHTREDVNNPSENVEQFLPALRRYRPAGGFLGDHNTMPAAFTSKLSQFVGMLLCNLEESESSCSKICECCRSDSSEVPLNQFQQLHAVRTAGRDK